MTELTLGQIVAGIAIITALISFYKLIVSGVDKTFEKHLMPLNDKMNKIDDKVNMLSDCIYQMLDHMQTNNNTGQMKRCLDEYNKWNREH